MTGACKRKENMKVLNSLDPTENHHPDGSEGGVGKQRFCSHRTTTNYR